MPLAAFRKLNEERERQGLSVFANPRNFTAGTVRQLEPSITAQRRMDYLRLLAAEGRTNLFRPAIESDGCAGAGGVQGQSEPQAGEESRRGLEIYSELGGASANRCLTRLTASSSRWTARRAARNWVSPARLRAGRLLTSTRRAERLRRIEDIRAAGRTHRQTDAGGGAEAGSDWRNDGFARHAAQHGRDRAAGSEDRRLGRGRARRRCDSESGEGGRGRRASSRPQAV